MEWYYQKTHYLKTLPSGCCTVRELMGRFHEGEWEYAIIQYKDGRKSLVSHVRAGVVLY